jgi:hypothetical protein
METVSSEKDNFFVCPPAARRIPSSAFCPPSSVDCFPGPGGKFRQASLGIGGSIIFTEEFSPALTPVGRVHFAYGVQAAPLFILPAGSGPVGRGWSGSNRRGL